jgi:hypothetical protein
VGGWRAVRSERACAPLWPFGPGLLIASGAAWLVADSGANALMAAGLGMLLYTVIVSPGYFLARRELPAVGMFGVLTALTAIALAVAVM